MNQNITVHISQATPQQISTVVRMWLDIDQLPSIERPFGGDKEDKPEQARHLIEHAVSSDNAVVLLALDYEEKILGTISGHIFDKPAVNIGCVGVVYGLWVEEAHRRQGIARQLLSMLEQSLMNKGAKAFQVGWDTNNSIAAQWWQQRGYAPYEVIASKLVENL